MKFSRLILFLVLMLIPSIAQADALKWANGSWGVSPDAENFGNEKGFQCPDNPLRVEIDPKNNRYHHQHNNSKISFESNSADILSSSDKFLIIQYDNEERVMDDGKPHIWIMFFLDQDRFYWVRKDWYLKTGSLNFGTPIRIRCDNPDVS